MRMVDKIAAAFGDLAGSNGGCVLGLSFKPDTDDIRESPALEIVAGTAVKAGAKVRAFDPAAMDRNADPSGHDRRSARPPTMPPEGADGIVILTEWNQFRALELTRLHELLENPLIVDLRNIYDPAKMSAAGFEYISLRPAGDRKKRVSASMTPQS